MDSQTPFLPEEITRNILKRLPVKSLIQFQCVCKHWKNIIKTRSFVADHLHHSSHQTPSLLVQQNSLCLCLTDCELQLQVQEIQNAPFINFLEGARIVGSCNGLLCVEIDQYKQFLPSILLWNPANRAFRYVSRRTYADSHDCVVGFGFSPIVNDYKIVRIWRICAKFYDAVDRVEVFSLSRGSWKGIDFGNLMGVTPSSESVTANGAIFWSGIKLGAEEKGEDDTDVIVSFDIAKEVFKLMPRPDLDYMATEKLAVYDNKLAMICRIWDVGDERDDFIVLWVKAEGRCAFGESRSWTKVYTSIPCSYTLDPMTIWRNQIVCRAFSEGDNGEGRDVLYLLNLTTNEVKSFDIPKCHYVHGMCNYVESLVSLGNLD